MPNIMGGDCASTICRDSTRPMPDAPGVVVKNGTNWFSPRGGPALYRPVPVGAVHPATQLDGAGAVARLDGVAQQVDQYLFQLVAVGGDGGVGVHHHVMLPALTRSWTCWHTTTRDSGARIGGGSRASDV